MSVLLSGRKPIWNRKQFPRSFYNINPFVIFFSFLCNAVNIFDENQYINMIIYILYVLYIITTYIDSAWKQPTTLYPFSGSLLNQELAIFPLQTCPQHFYQFLIFGPWLGSMPASCCIVVLDLVVLYHPVHFPISMLYYCVLYFLFNPNLCCGEPKQWFSSWWSELYSSH